jgi:hypothetical protein
MADPFEADPTRPLYRAIPVLEVAEDESTAILDVPRPAAAG